MLCRPLAHLARNGSGAAEGIPAQEGKQGVELTRTNRRIAAEHGVIASYPDDFYGYFGWPTIARMPDGTIVAAASGLRNEHVCPFGRSVFFTSADEGRTWSSPRVVNDSPLDDRDTGILSCGGRRLMLTWFTTDNRRQLERRSGDLDEEQRRLWEQGLLRAGAPDAGEWVGAWCRTSEDGGDTWSSAIRVAQTAPHGPILLANGELLYFGKLFEVDMAGFSAGIGAIAAMRSRDFGRSWEPLGTVPLFAGTEEGNYHEPHVAELPGGKLVGLIRLEPAREGADPADLGLERFMQMYTESNDGGVTWTRAEPMNFHGSPPHLLAHSSGALVGTYGRRREPFGERAMISCDRGESWQYDYILRDDGPDGDLGYPSSVELEDGSILTAYYQKPRSAGDKCAFLWSRWRLPDPKGA